MFDLPAKHILRGFDSRHSTYPSDRGMMRLNEEPAMFGTRTVLVFALLLVAVTLPTS
jgi:hypothetical protein